MLAGSPKKPAFWGALQVVAIVVNHISRVFSLDSLDLCELASKELYFLLALAGRNLINLILLVSLALGAPQYIATIPSARSVLSH